MEALRCSLEEATFEKIIHTNHILYSLRLPSSLLVFSLRTTMYSPLIIVGKSMPKRGAIEKEESSSANIIYNIVVLP